MKPFLLVLLGVLLVGQIIPFSLSFDSRLPETEMSPEQLESFRATESYNRAIEWAGLAYALTSFPAGFLILYGGFGPRLERRYGKSRLRWGARILFLIGMAVWMNLVGMPYALRVFAVHRELGITHLETPEWIRLVLLGLPIPLSLFTLRCLIVYCTMPIFRRWWWLASTVLLFIIFNVIPEWASLKQPIDPVATLTPLTNPPVRKVLDDVADRAGYRLEYYTVDRSERSRTVNMYVAGRIGREYVVLTDTIIDALNEHELAVILAHELGHQANRKRRMIQDKIIVLIGMLATYGLTFLATGRAAIPEEERLQTIVKLLLIGTLISLISAPCHSALNRREERLADDYALALLKSPRSFSSAVLKVAEINASPYDLPGWVYWQSASHPTVRQRLHLAATWEPDPP